jgi:hypothetical protein
MLVIDQNGSPRTAWINLGGSLISLVANTYHPYQCEFGEQIASEWAQNSVTMRLSLDVSSSPGAESFWFSGDMYVRHAEGEVKAKVRGACGC